MLPNKLKKAKTDLSKTIFTSRVMDFKDISVFWGVAPNNLPPQISTFCWDLGRILNGLQIFSHQLWNPEFRIGYRPRYWNHRNYLKDTEKSYPKSTWYDSIEEFTLQSLCRTERKQIATCPSPSLVLSLHWASKPHLSPWYSGTIMHRAKSTVVRGIRNQAYQIITEK